MVKVTAKSDKDFFEGYNKLFKGMMTVDKEIREIELSEILPNPEQPRINFTEKTIVELAQSIKKYGLLQPILLRRESTHYQLISGERRWRACKLIGKKTVSALVCTCSDKEVAQVALIENLQRENLNAIEEARAYGKLLMQMHVTQTELSEYIGKSRSHIANFLRLLRLPCSVQNAIMEDKLNMGQAKPLLTLKDKKKQQVVAQYILEHKLSARQAEQLVKKLLKKEMFANKQHKQIKEHDIYIADTEEKLMLLLETKVNIKRGLKKGKIEIEFTSDEDLMRIVDIVNRQITKKASMAKDFFV